MAKVPDERLRLTARRYPGGWVYEVVGDFGDDDAVPPEAIRGAWKVNEEGEIVGDFVPNPNYLPRAKDPS